MSSHKNDFGQRMCVIAILRKYLYYQYCKYAMFCALIWNNELSFCYDIEELKQKNCLYGDIRWDWDDFQKNNAWKLRSGFRHLFPFYYLFLTIFQILVAPEENNIVLLCKVQHLATTCKKYFADSESNIHNIFLAFQLEVDF